MARQFCILRFENQGGQVFMTCGQEQERGNLEKKHCPSTILISTFIPINIFANLVSAGCFILIYQLQKLQFYSYKTHLDLVESRRSLEWSRGCFASDVIGIGRQTDSLLKPVRLDPPDTWGMFDVIPLSSAFILENCVYVTVVNGLKITKTIQQFCVWTKPFVLAIKVVKY